MRNESYGFVNFLRAEQLGLVNTRFFLTRNYTDEHGKRKEFRKNLLLKNLIAHVENVWCPTPINIEEMC
jgi:hypothetical protein